jgi:hypothetical protein
VSGMLSKPGLAVWSSAPPPAAGGALCEDMAADAVAATAQHPIAAPGHAGGPATVVSFTVTYGADDPLRPARTAIVADLANGDRTAATCEDEAFARHALAESPIGQIVHLEDTTFAL